MCTPIDDRQKSIHATARSPGRLLIIDGGERMAIDLAREMAERHFDVTIARTAEDGLAAARRLAPHHVLLETRLGPENGLNLVPKLRTLLPRAGIIIHTSFATLQAAVWAMKAGATDILAKPADPDIVAALLSGDTASIPDHLACPYDLRRRYIHETVKRHRFNMTQSAAVLKLTRRSVQRRVANDRTAYEATLMQAAE